jgi:hypothetical protein
MYFELLNDIKVKVFDFKENRINVAKTFNAIQIKLNVNNPIVLLENISENDLRKFIGQCEYRFRKGVGYKGEIYRLKFKEIKGEKVIFHRFKKENRKLKVDMNTTLEIDFKELKYIYPLVLSPDITEKGLQWSENYIIFPYEYGERQPIAEDKLKKEAPNLYNYFLSHQREIIEQSRYNKRIQNVKEFYGVIRVGYYSYSKFFVAMRDNTKLTSCIVEWIKTHWKERKNPVFDNHISYVSLTSKEEAEYLINKLREPKLKEITKVVFDSRSIGSRLPFKIPKYKGEIK